MYLKHSVVILLVLLKFHNYKGCGSSDDEPHLSPKGYDLNHPYKISLDHQLDEISGLAYYPKDTAVFAIADENGVFYKIFLNRGGYAQKWTFGKKEDFEDLVLHDSVVYVLASKGDIVKLRFTQDSIIKEKTKFPDGDKKANEFESLYWDDSTRQLIMLCKQCEEDKKKKSAWAYSPDSATYTPALFSIDEKTIIEKSGDKKIKFKPSATAINPVTNEVYILASVGKLLVITDRNGTVKEVYHLDPEIYNQPEGLAFTPKGDMIISNEKGEEATATVLIFKRSTN
jgi:uncharacterized protein YjiK